MNCFVRPWAIRENKAEWQALPLYREQIVNNGRVMVQHQQYF